MAGQGRLGDKAYVPLDAHGCPFCPHPATGPAIAGSFDVFVNRRPALRVGDPGIHAACCGRNIWQASAGSETVFINGRSAHRLHDATRHCGGDGWLVEGSPNVIVGSITAASSAGRRRGAPASAPGDAAGRDAAPGDAPGGDTASADPVDPAMDLDPAMVNAQAQAEVLRAAAAAHIPFCEECERTGTIA